MKIDMSQFDNLEFDNIGQWPYVVKVTMAIITAVLVAGLSFWLLVVDKMTALELAKIKEIELKQEYQSKYHVAANLELFQAQMVEAQSLFANQLKSLPESHETPGLLDDITFVGTTSGLDFVKINWQPEIKQEIYIELPIGIEVIGTYHEFGQFVSKVAGLPRIVTLHNFKINISAKNSDVLHLVLQAKTYRYRETEPQ